MAYGFNADKSKADMLTTAQISEMLTNFLLQIYPVGAIYMSTRSTNPGTLFGGTWTAWGSGRVPVGVNTSDTNFNTVEKTGGASTVTLTTQQIPSHSHSYNDTQPNSLVTSAAAMPGQLTATDSKQVSRTTGTAGGGAAHNNLQPYITCYMWKRTA